MGDRSHDVVPAVVSRKEDAPEQDAANTHGNEDPRPGPRFPGRDRLSSEPGYLVRIGRCLPAWWLFHGSRPSGQSEAQPMRGAQFIPRPPKIRQVMTPAPHWQALIPRRPDEPPSRKDSNPPVRSANTRRTAARTFGAYRRIFPNPRKIVASLCGAQIHHSGAK
jgi:hypothetical protein